MIDIKQKIKRILDEELIIDGEYGGETYWIGRKDIAVEMIMEEVLGVFVSTDKETKNEMIYRLAKANIESRKELDTVLNRDSMDKIGIK